MAKGYWRNWDEIECSGPKCKNVIYKKDATKRGDKYYCPMCVPGPKRTKIGTHY